AVTDASSEQAAMAQIDQGEAQAFAASVASGNGIYSGFGSDTLVVGASDPIELAGEEVRAKCRAKCDLVIQYLGEDFAVVDCGDGSCPTCPPGLQNLIVHHWCAYVSPSQKSAIVLHLAFGGTWGPFLVS